MAPIPATLFSQNQDVARPTLHHLVRRGEEGRIAGMLVGCLIGGIAAVSLVYFCFNCVFSPEPRQNTARSDHTRACKAHPHHAHSQARTYPHQHPHHHRWTHHHHKHAHSHQHRGKARPKKQCLKAKRKTKPETARCSKRTSQPRGQTIRFMPMPPMAAMPAPPAPAAGLSMGVGLGMGGGMDVPLGDDFVDYGPVSGQGFGMDMGWNVDPSFRPERFAAEGDIDGGREATCNECCYSFLDALCGIPSGARDPSREAAGDGEMVMDDNEMAAV